jgi:hypothetical protein
VVFEVQLTFEGVEHGLDELPERLEQVLTGAGRVVAVARSQQVHPPLGQEAIKFG